MLYFRVTFTVIYSQVLFANIYKYFYYYGEYHLDYTGYVRT